MPTLLSKNDNYNKYLILNIFWELSYLVFGINATHNRTLVIILDFNV